MGNGGWEIVACTQVPRITFGIWFAERPLPRFAHLPHKWGGGVAMGFHGSERARDRYVPKSRCLRLGFYAVGVAVLSRAIATGSGWRRDSHIRKIPTKINGIDNT